MTSEGPRPEAALAEVRAIIDDTGHTVDNARRAVVRLDSAFEAGELVRTPALDAMLADLDVTLEQDQGQKLGGKSAEAARLILRAISRELDNARRATMSEDAPPPRPPDLDPGTRRALAVGLFNRAWELLGSADRTPDQDDEMIHAAHASRYHWGEIGEPVNRARGEWQCSRVYAVLGRSEPALWHAKRCLEICEAHEIADFDLAFAFEALARASRVAGDRAESERWLARARESAAAIADPEDRALLEADLASIGSTPKELP